MRDLEQELLKKLYERYYRELYLYVYSICRHRAVTEDVLQETFLKAFLALKDSHTNMRAWLYLTSRNICYNLLKREKRLVSEEELAEKQREGKTGDLLEGILLHRAMDELPKLQREILVLQYFGGFQQREIAAMLGLTPGNVRVLAHRAKKELKQLLEVEKDDL